MCNSDYDSDIFIAGCGTAGVASAVFAHKRGLSVIQAGSSAELIFLSLFYYFFVLLFLLHFTCLNIVG